MDVTELPFNKLIGIVARDGRVILEPSRQHGNHVESIHATAIYGAAEAASGERLLREFSELTTSMIVVLRSSTVKYRRPASIDMSIVACGSVEKEAAMKFRKQLASRGRSVISVHVIVAQADNEIFRGEFSWFVALEKSPPLDHA
jgi:pyruvate/2-oxoacid:ferredoxin oxidoreductase alpha subunit